MRNVGAGASGVVKDKFSNEGTLKYMYSSRPFTDAAKTVSAMEQQVHLLNPHDACLLCIMTVDNYK